MRLSLRFIVPLVIVLALLAYAAVPLVDALTLKWFVHDLEIRSKLIASTMEEPLADLLAANSRSKLLNYFETISQDERLYAIGFCDVDNRLAYKTRPYPEAIRCDSRRSKPAFTSAVVRANQGSVHVARVSIEANGRPLGELMIVHDMSWVHRRSADTKWYIFYSFVIIGAIISCVTVLIAHLSWRGWLAGVRALLKGERLLMPVRSDHVRELQPVAQDLRDLLRELEADRRMRDESQMTWTPATLKTILHEDLKGDEVLIVSNRQPYIHNHNGDRVEVQVPASGLVTALEPVMRACSGTWIAHGNGTADREMVDAFNRVGVPPENPVYRIRRVWMSAEEEAGYYYGFANEGLWPLAHLADVRPMFRSFDWQYYKEINQRFAWAVLEEAKTDNPVVLVQDYHLALAPKMIREHLPDATIITFWHIPWPNAERYGICPWREELLTGLLGSSILGFHTRLHCNNFLDSVDRLLEARIDRDASTISYGGKSTAVKHYPISIEWPTGSSRQTGAIHDCQALVRQRNGIGLEHRVGVGVERLDYTKGILERFLAVERLLELHPEWIGHFSFIQIAAPSRAIISQYQQYTNHVITAAESVNKRFGRSGYQPILLKVVHHEPSEIMTYYRGADLCMVSSLHDGMNLVAKEFVAARDDEQGVLILSQFAGAARELPEALIVNPYDTDQCALALHRALTMPPLEQRVRMRSMRAIVQEFNVYRWAGRMLLDAARMRQQERVRRHAGSRDYSV